MLANWSYLYQTYYSVWFGTHTHIVLIIIYTTLSHAHKIAIVLCSPRERLSNSAHTQQTLTPYNHMYTQKHTHTHTFTPESFSLYVAMRCKHLQLAREGAHKTNRQTVSEPHTHTHQHHPRFRITSPLRIIPAESTHTNANTRTDTQQTSMCINCAQRQRTGVVATITPIQPTRTHILYKNTPHHREI